MPATYTFYAPRVDKPKQPYTAHNFSATKCHLSDLCHLPDSYKKKMC